MPHPASLRSLVKHDRIVLLQGPMGPFFWRLARFLRAQGATVGKVNFNGGDWLFYPRGAAACRVPPEQLPGWFEAYFRRTQCQAVVMFGQTRPVHEAARAVARQLGLAIYVFEEGYLRPDYVTLEEGGVNAHSGLPRDPNTYRDWADVPPRRPEPTHQRFARMAWYAALYALACWLMYPLCRHHRYHRPLNPWVEAARWVRGGLRKLAFALREAGVLSMLTSAGCSGRWYLLPLQVHNDSQITHHSTFADVEEVIDVVMQSFARSAPRDHWLVIKHHPMDRAYRDYGRFIRERSRALGVCERVLYVHDLHLPTLLKHTKGVVTVNSTTGLQALYHKVPVKTLGECFYDIEGLVHQGTLDDFWHAPAPVDVELYRRFREYLVRHTQLNASFYGRTPALAHPLPPLVSTTASPAHVERGLESQHPGAQAASAHLSSAFPLDLESSTASSANEGIGIGAPAEERSRAA